MNPDVGLCAGGWHHIALFHALIVCPLSLCCQAVMSTVLSARALVSASDANLLMPPYRANVCWNVAETTSWMPPPKFAQVRLFT